MILLDTCTLLWLADDQSRLSERARELIEQNPDSLFVSAISAFEIGLKSRAGRLALPMDPKEWFRRAIEQHGLLEQPVTWEIAEGSTALPPPRPPRCST